MDNKITNESIKPKQPGIVPIEHDASNPAEENLGEAQRASTPAKPEILQPAKKRDGADVEKEVESPERANELYEEQLPPETRIN